MLEKVIVKITKQQQKYKKYSAVWAVGEQLKDICRTTPGAAELVLQDLENQEMSVDKCEKKIKERADELHKTIGGGSIGISPIEADKIIREFYGLPDTPDQPRPTVTAPADQEPKRNDRINFESFFV